MMATTIEDVLAMDDMHRETVPVPEWKNAEFLVVSMTAEERAELEKRWSKKDAASDPAAFRADVLERTWKKPEDGTPFGTSEQIKAVMKKNASAVERIFEAACRVAALNKNDVEALAKN